MAKPLISSMHYDIELNDSGLVGLDCPKYCVLFSIQGVCMPQSNSHICRLMVLSDSCS